MFESTLFEGSEERMQVTERVSYRMESENRAGGSCVTPEGRRWLRGIFSVFLGGVFTLSTWLVVRPLPCVDVFSCPFAILERGFPLPWMIQHGVSRIFPFHEGVMTRIDYGGLASDLAVWSWLSFAGLVLGSKRRPDKAESLTPRALRFVGMVLGLATIVAGLAVSLVVARLFLEYFPPAVFSLSLLGYLVAILGAGAASAAYRRSQATHWLVCLAVGTLITLADTVITLADTITSFVTYLIGASTGLAIVTPNGSYGFPFPLLTVEIPAGLPPSVDVAWWAFVMDVLIWSSILIVLLVILSGSRLRMGRE